MVHGWPANHSFKNLKCEVILNLIEDHDDMATKLQPHLDKQLLTYQQADEEINAQDNLEDIPEALGDFIIAAISLTMGIPIYIVYLTMEIHQDAGTLCTVTKYGAKMEYLFCKDRNKASAPHPSLVVMAYNGIDYYVPTIPKEIGKMTRNTSNTTTHLDDAENLIETIVEDLPPSLCKTNLQKLLQYMWASRASLTCTSLATGTTDSAGVPSEVPVPKLSASLMVTKTAHRRAAATLDEVPPEKRKNETDVEFSMWKKDYKAAVSKAALRDTKLGKNQCPCGETFQSLEAVLNHQANVHPDPNSWKCTTCPKVMNSKEHCWSDACKHLGKYYHYCDVEYKDKEDLDADGNLKQKVCIKGSDEVTWVQFHLETEHGVGKASVRCDYCNRPQQSGWSKKKHHDACDQEPNKDGAPNHFCEYCSYSCQVIDLLSNHMWTDHPAESGLKEAKHWCCSKCGKILKQQMDFKGTTVQPRSQGNGMEGNHRQQLPTQNYLVLEV